MADSQHICAVAGCHNPKKARRLCNSHYARWKRHGDPLGGSTGKGYPLKWAEALAENPPEGCAEWPFATNGNGYGWAWFQGRRIGAHRMLLVIATGQNPTDMDAAHGACHNRACVNPRHLSWQSRSNNIQDHKRDGRKGYVLCEQDVLNIRKSRKSAKAIAEQYSLSTSTVYKVKQRKLWANV